MLRKNQFPHVYKLALCIFSLTFISMMASQNIFLCIYKLNKLTSMTYVAPVDILSSLNSTGIQMTVSSEQFWNIPLLLFLIMCHQVGIYSLRDHFSRKPQFQPFSSSNKAPISTAIMSHPLLVVLFFPYNFPSIIIFLMELVVHVMCPKYEPGHLCII